MPFSQFLSKIFYLGVYCSLGTDHSNSSMRTKYSTLMSTVPLVMTIQIQACINAPKILCQCLLFPWYWPRWCLLFLSFKHALSWCTTMWQPKSKNHAKSRPIKKVGFFCYQCGRDDFELNQKSLSAHVRHCSFNPNSTSQTKRKSDHHPSSLHSSGHSVSALSQSVRNTVHMECTMVMASTHIFHMLVVAVNK